MYNWAEFNINIPDNHSEDTLLIQCPKCFDKKQKAPKAPLFYCKNFGLAFRYPAHWLGGFAPGISTPLSRFRFVLTTLVSYSTCSLSN